MKRGESLRHAIKRLARQRTQANKEMINFGLICEEIESRMAAGIPGARFVALQGRNHLFLETEPAFGQFLEHTRAFLAG